MAWHDGANGMAWHATWHGGHGRASMQWTVNIWPGLTGHDMSLGRAIVIPAVDAAAAMMKPYCDTPSCMQMHADDLANKLMKVRRLGFCRMRIIIWLERLQQAQHCLAAPWFDPYALIMNPL